MSNPTMRTAILAQTDTLDTAQQQALDVLIDRAKENSEIQQITTNRVNGILQITVIYNQVTHAIYNFVGPLQDTKGIFAKHADIFGEEDITNMYWFRMVLDGDNQSIEYDLSQQVSVVDVEALNWSAGKRLRRLQKLQWRIRIIELPADLQRAINARLAREGTNTVALAA